MYPLNKEKVGCAKSMHLTANMRLTMVSTFTVLILCIDLLTGMLDVLFSCFVPAAECRNFLLYYLVPSLQGVLPNEYLAHALLLSKSIRTLLGDQITSGDMEVVCELLDLFWKLFEHYYGRFPNFVC